MQCTVMYTLISPLPETVGNIIAKWANECGDLRRITAYLEQRGITARRTAFQLSEEHEVYDASFTIDYASPAHQTATELIMSGCQYTCKLHSELIKV